jgi:hypothetical protein
MRGLHVPRICGDSGLGRFLGLCPIVTFVCLIAPLPVGAVSVSVTPETPTGSGQTVPTSFVLPLGQSLDFTAIAMDTDPVPTGGTYGCPVSGPVWTAATVVDPSDESGANVTTTTEAVTTPANGVRIKVHAQFSQPGVWTFLVQGTATYTDSPCTDTWTGTGTLSYQVLVVSVQMTPNPAYVGLGGTLSLTPNVEPPDAMLQLNFQVADSSVATIMGDASDLTVIGVATGVTSVTATLVPSNGQLLIGNANMGTLSVDVIGIQLTPSPAYVAVANTVSLTATVTPSAAGSQVSFVTDDNTIATVSGSAPTLTVTGVAIGSTNVTASVAGEVIALATVSVGTLTVTLSPSPVVVPVNGSANLAVTVTPSSQAGLITFDTASSVIATVPSSPPTWENDEALLTVSGGAVPGTTQVRAWAAGVVVAVAAVNVVTPPSVQITTKGNLELIQDPNSSLNSITLSAQITPTTDTIVWTLSGPGYDPNGTGNTWVRYNTGAQVNGVGTITIILDKNSLTWANWDEDSSVTVTASSAANPSLQSQTTLLLTKFRRHDRVARGSQSVSVRAMADGVLDDGLVGWSVRSIDGTKDLYGHVYAGGASATLSYKIDHQWGQQLASGNYRVWYTCTNDKGDGSYSYRITMTATGSYHHRGIYDGWINDSGITIATARAASVDNTMVQITSGVLGEGYSYKGSPTTVTFGITGMATTAAVGGMAGLSMTCSTATPPTIEVEMDTVDPYVFTLNGSSTVGTQIDVTKLLRTAAAADVNQSNDNDWDLWAIASQDLSVPWTSYLIFQPGF